MLHRSLQLGVALLAMNCPAPGFGQPAQPPQYFVVCASQPNQPTIYYSGVLQGPATALQGFRAGFSEFLAQRYAYKGVVGCSPNPNAVNAHNLITNQSAAFRKAKRTVVETGWTQSAVAAAPVARASAVVNMLNKMPQGSAAPAATGARVGHAATAATAAAPGDAASGGSASEANPLTSVLSSVFGTDGGSADGSGGGDCGGSAAPVAKGGASKTGASKTRASAAGTGGGGCASPLDQVSKTLTSVFGNKATSGGTSSEAAPSPQAADPAGGLGSGQAQGTKLVVYGCGRQDTRVACVTNLTNQNQKDTLVQAGDVWKDAFIVDDRGDRHKRSGGFFLNVDGEQRQQLDISYGKTAQFILMFDGVQPKVQKVSLRSSGAGLDVEEISLLAANGNAAADPQH